MQEHQSTGSDADDDNDRFRHMDRIARHYQIDSAEFREWALRVEESAKMICDDPKGERVRFSVVEKPEGLTIDTGKADASTIACVIKAIRQHLAGMPDNLSMWYMAFLRYLEGQEERLETQE